LGGWKWCELLTSEWLVLNRPSVAGFHSPGDSNTNAMPESVTDRPTKAHEYLFLLSKSQRYFYDAEAIKEPALCGWRGSSFTDERDLWLYLLAIFGSV
jgi:hypothetical protein